MTSHHRNKFEITNYHTFPTLYQYVNTEFICNKWLSVCNKANTFWLLFSECPYVDEVGKEKTAIAGKVRVLNECPNGTENATQMLG